MIFKKNFKKNSNFDDFLIFPKITYFEFLLFFSIVFCKKWKFCQVHLSMVRKKKFRDGSDGPKNEFKTLLSNAAIKKYDRLMNFFHFWWFDFFHFLEAQKILKIAFPKNAIFTFFSPKFTNFAYFLLFFTFFVSKIHFFYQNFNFVF